MAPRRPSISKRLPQQPRPNSPNPTPNFTTDRPATGRHVEMIDSWTHGDDRRDRGRVDRGVRRSPSPSRDRRASPSRDSRDSKDRPPAKSRSNAQSERPRDRSPERRRRSRSPARDSRNDVRERNRGRELLDTRGPEKSNRSITYTSPSSVKRRKSRSPSPPRGHKKSRRELSRSPSRSNHKSAPFSKADKKRRPLSPLPPRRDSPRRPSDIRSEFKQRNRDSLPFDRRGRSPSPRRDRREPPLKSESARRDRSPRRSSQQPRDRSPFDGYKEDRAKDQNRERSPFVKPREKEQKREHSPFAGRRSPSFDRPPNRSRQPSPRGPRFNKDQRGGKSPRGGRRGSRDDFPRDEFRPSKGKQKSGKPPTASGANSIEVKGTRASVSSATTAASGANSIEVKADKMNGRGNYYGHGYNANPMQAAFPLKPQYNQGPPVDPRQYSQSPQHQMTPNSHYSGSPQAQSPYSAGRGNYGQQQFSPQPQYPQNYQQPQPPQQPNYPTGPQSQTHYYNQAQSPPYQAPSGPMNAQYPQGNFRGNQRAFRGNNQFNQRGGRGDHRGGRGGHFQNQQWNAQAGVGRGQHDTSGNVTPQHGNQQGSPQQFPQNAGSRAGSVVGSQAGSQVGTPQHKPTTVAVEDDTEDLFRPSKELQVEDKESTKKKDEEKMPPPSRPVPTGPQSQQNASKFSFTLSGKSKVLPTAPKLEISQKLNAGPARNVQFTSPDRPRGPNSRGIPTEPASARQNFREPPAPKPPAPTTRMVKKTLKRLKERPQLPDEFKKSDSVYYRKPGNESVVGSGTYGKVFKAVHVFTKDLVALKKIRMEGERDGFPVTAVREIKLLQSLKHANIVNMQEVMVEKNDCFMVFEYLSHDLTGLLNHPTFKLEASHKKHLAKQLFEGLDYLHRRGVLHRDIKAANILVSNEGQLKIADFGLARFYAKRRQLDYTNRVITIWYRSPELLLGETQYGPAVDIWSAACVLVEIFTRHAIFPGDGTEMSQLEKIYAILGTPTKAIWPGLTDMAWFALLRPSARRPNVFEEKYKDRVTPAAYELLEAMLQYDPDKRPSASDVLEHPYFTTEEPQPRQATELALLEGDWHEFESKALRKENERKDKEARRQVQKEKEAAAKAEKEKKRALEGSATGEPDAKRVQTGPPPADRDIAMAGTEGGK